jgi:hypothetical protein
VCQQGGRFEKAIDLLSGITSTLSYLAKMPGIHKRPNRVVKHRNARAVDTCKARRAIALRKFWKAGLTKSDIEFIAAMLPAKPQSSYNRDQARRPEGQRVALQPTHDGGNRRPARTDSPDAGIKVESEAGSPPRPRRMTELDSRDGQIDSLKAALERRDTQMNGLRANSWRRIEELEQQLRAAQRLLDGRNEEVKTLASVAERAKKQLRLAISSIDGP